MKIVHRNPWIRSISGKEVDLKYLYENKSLQVLRFDLQPGESMGPKILPWDMLYYVVEGNPTIRLAEDKMMGTKGMLVECPAHLVHSFSSNVGDTIQVLGIKVPRGEKKEHFRNRFFYEM
jgi:quercetin dioxygenase-like cupin family protein